MPDLDGDFLVKLIACVFGALLVANQVRALMGKSGDVKLDQPVYVALQKEFTPLERTEKLEAEIRKVDEDRRASVARCYAETRELVAGLRTEMREAAKEHREDMTGVNKRMTDVLAGLSRLEGRHDER